MKLNDLIMLQEEGLLQTEEKGNKYLLGNETLTKEELHSFVEKLGWKKQYLSDVQLLEKTNKFVRGIKNHIKDEDVLERTDITFENLPLSGYDKTMDRIIIKMKNVLDLIVLYGAPKNYASTSRYEVYSSKNDFSTPVYKLTTLKKLGMLLNMQGVMEEE